MKTNKINVVLSLKGLRLDSVSNYKSLGINGSNGDTWTNERVKTGYSYTTASYTDVSVRRDGVIINTITNKFDGNPFNND